MFVTIFDCYQKSLLEIIYYLNQTLLRASFLTIVSYKQIVQMDGI